MNIHIYLIYICVPKEPILHNINQKHSESINSDKGNCNKKSKDQQKHAKSGALVLKPQNPRTMTK
jgi:hypothetical protein